MSNSGKNNEQFEQIVRDNKSTIYTVCYMFSKDADEVADLFQEVLINLWKGFDGFQGRSDLKTWIYRVALNTCISIDRKKKRRSKTELSMDINLFSDSDSDTKQVDMLRRRINRLKPFDRAIVLLWLENMSYDEIGAVVGTPPRMSQCDSLELKRNLRKWIKKSRIFRTSR